MVEQPYLGMVNVKPVEWVGSSYKDFISFPDLVQDTMGHALYLAQTGRTHAAAKPLKGFGGAGVLEIIEDDREIRARGLCFARVPKEIKTRDSNAPRRI